MPSGLIIVTGGSRGIGAAICRRLATDGHAVAVNYTADAKAAEATVSEIKEVGGACAGVSSRCRGPGSASSAVRPGDESARAARRPRQQRRRHGSGRDDRSAGSCGADAALCNQRNWDNPRLQRGCLRLSTKHGGSGGSIVNISSIAARLGGLPGLASYAATKGAVESFTKGLATEVGPEGIRVNAVAPGFTATDLTSDQIAQPGFRERIEGMTPLRRVGVPEEIAEAAAWLISPAACFVTGSVVTASGGR